MFLFCFREKLIIKRQDLSELKPQKYCLFSSVLYPLWSHWKWKETLEKNSHHPRFHQNKRRFHFWTRPCGKNAPSCCQQKTLQHKRQTADYLFQQHFGYWNVKDARTPEQRRYWGDNQTLFQWEFEERKYEYMSICK